MGDDALVPPRMIHPPSYVLYTASPVFGSATAETSATVRCPQPGSVCQLGLGLNALHPLPPSLQAPSTQPRAAVVDWTRLVPPTATTYCDDAGKLAP